MKDRPLVLLDVDGVINDFEHVGTNTGLWSLDIIRSHGYQVSVPEYMPKLIQEICAVAEVHWCTTWRHRANDEIAEHLEIGPLPVIDDGTNRRVVDWKAGAAYDLVAEALAAGRRVLWIEDFYGTPPIDEMPVGTEYLDTAANPAEPVLRVEHLPTWLEELILSAAIDN
ncbi:MAG: hypothetical protein ACKOA6_04060 [Actinomycetota bacterium]